MLLLRFPLFTQNLTLAIPPPGDFRLVASVGCASSGSLGTAPPATTMFAKPLFLDATALSRVFISAGGFAASTVRAEAGVSEGNKGIP